MNPWAVMHVLVVGGGIGSCLVSWVLTAGVACMTQVHRRPPIQHGTQGKLLLHVFDTLRVVSQSVFTVAFYHACVAVVDHVLSSWTWNRLNILGSTWSNASISLTRQRPSNLGWGSLIKDL